MNTAVTNVEEGTKEETGRNFYQAKGMLFSRDTQDCRVTCVSKCRRYFS